MVPVATIIADLHFGPPAVMRVHVENWMEDTDNAGVAERVAASIHRAMRIEMAARGC